MRRFDNAFQQNVYDTTLVESGDGQYGTPDAPITRHGRLAFWDGYFHRPSRYGLAPAAQAMYIAGSDVAANHLFQGVS